MSELKESHRKILELFRELGVRELDVDTVARKFNWKRNTAKKYMDQLTRWGYLHKKTGGVYELAEQEKGKTTEEAEEKSAGPTTEEMGREAMEVKPSGEVVESFYFYYRSSVVPLRISSLEQLAAVLKYRLVSPEELAYAVRTGFLQTWLERSLHDPELAKQLDELRGLSDQELFNEATRILTEKVKIC